MTEIVTPETHEPQKETFTREYVQELRAENKDWRLKYQETQKQLEELQQKTVEATTQLQQETTQRIMRAELKALAMNAGMVDMDALKLADLTKVSLNDDGTLSGAEEMLVALKTTKPYLFSQQVNSSHPGSPPTPKPPEIKKATAMTVDEYAKARTAYVNANK